MFETNSCKINSLALSGEISTEVQQLQDYHPEGIALQTEISRGKIIDKLQLLTRKNAKSDDKRE